MLKMDRGTIHLLVVFTWIAQITTSASDWKELDGISSSVVKTHFVQLQDPHEMETETNFPHNFQHAGEVNYISKAIVGRDVSDGNNTEAAVLKVNKQDENLRASAPTTTPSSEQTDSDEYSEEDTEKPLALALLGTNVRFSISAEDERYTKKKQQLIYDATDKGNDTNSTSMWLITPTTSKTTTEIISSTVKLTKPVPLLTITRSNQTGTTTEAKKTNPTSPTTRIPTTPTEITEPTVLTSSTTLKSTLPPTTTTVMDIPSTTATQVRRATIRSRLARPKMIAHFAQKKAKILTTIATTQSPVEESSTIQLSSFTETSSSSTSTPMSTPSQTEPNAVMTLLKDMTADYPLDTVPDIETFYERERKQSPSPTMSASTTNTIVISSIIGGCAILFFAVMMVFYMWKQRKVRRRRKRPIPKLSLGKPNNNWHFGQTYENG